MIEFRKKYTQFSKLTITFVVENNLRYASWQVVGALFKDGISYKGDHTESIIGEYDFWMESGNIGAFKNRLKTIHYVMHASDTIRTGRLAIHESVGTACNTEDISKILAEAREELCRFKWSDSDLDNIRYKSFVSKSSIGGKEGGRTNDDLAIVILMLIYYTFHALKTDEDYEQFLENVKSFTKSLKSSSRASN